MAQLVKFVVFADDLAPMKKLLIFGLFVALCVGAIVWRQRQLAVRGSASPAARPTVSTTVPGPNTTGVGKMSTSLANAGTNLPVSREMDLSVNPYAAGLHEPGKAKRPWEADYIKTFQTAKVGDPVQFELTGGVLAQGDVKIIQNEGGQVSYVSGVLTAPETGKFFFLTPPVGGKAGSAVGVVEFPASKTAYRIEPTGLAGAPELWKRRLDEVICMDLPAVDPAKLPAAAPVAAATNGTENLIPLRPDQVAYYVPNNNSNIVSLQSYPGSPAVLLLDFAGGYTASWGGVNYARPPVDNGTIKDIWKRVAEDYLPFNINVTTDFRVYAAAPAASRQRCCFTTTPITAAGVAYEGSWNWGSDTVCWSVYYVGKPAAEVGAHEPGHTLGLSHETQEIPNGTNGTTHNEYYAGQGSGATSWAPIMGAAYYDNVTTFSHGEFQYASNLQDQLNIIATANNNVTYRADDTGGTLATSRYLEVYTNYTAFAEGVIERTDDTDAFQFTTAGGTVTLTANPVGDWADLAVMATLADATDTIIASNNPQTVISASITTNLPAGTYTFRVTGAGRNDPVTTGFSSYASLGYYSITGSIAGARLPTRLTVAEHATNNTTVGTVVAVNTNSSPLGYAIVGGNTGATFSVDNSGVVRVANNALLDYYQLATNTTLYAAQFEVFMNITNVNNPALTELNRRVVIAVQQLYPPVPAYVTATPDTGLRIDLSWGGGLSAASYNVKRSTKHGGPYTTIASLGGTAYVDSGLTNGTTYYYVVSAVNTNGESANSAEVSALAQAVANFGFETPGIGANYQYNPVGAVWTFSGGSGNGAGILGNGSGFSNPSSPEGTQAAFVQSYGTISQTLSGFVPGTTYQIRYAAAQRPGNSESWNVMIDNTVIQSNSPGGSSYTMYTAAFTASATAHTLTFVGTDLAGGDNTVFIDNVQVSIATPTILNFSFETPSVGAYSYNPAGGSWAFSGGSPSGSGILANGSGFGNPGAPLGTQAAFIQEYGTISQTLTGFTPGKTYTLSYSAAQRTANAGGESWNVKIDSNVIQSNSPGSTGYTTYTISFVATAATHTLTFAGTDLAGGDNTVFLDNVGIISTIQPVAAAVALTSPTNNAVFPATAPLYLTATVTTNGNVINGVQFIADNITSLGLISASPYTLAWVNPSGGSHSVIARVLFNNGSTADSSSINLTIINRTLNLGFETPSLGSGNYSYNPTGGSWTFTGSDGTSGSGIAANGSGFGNANAPEGTQAALLQGYGNISQTLSGFVPGTNYTITYSAAQRSTVQNGGESWNVTIDGAVIKTNNPGSSSYTTYTASFTATAAMHTLAFVGTDLAGGDNTVFIDNLSFNPPLITPVTPAVLTDTLPATAADVVGSQVTFMAAFTSTNPITYQWQKITGGLLSNVAGATNSMLTLTNLQLGDAAYYRLLASNVWGAAVSAASPLVISNLPAAVTNVIAAFAAQTGLGSASPTFTPTWTVAPGSLLIGQSPSSVGSGSFGQNVTMLTDGSFGTLPNGGGSTTEVSCGSSAGQSVTYSLGNAVGGYNVSNIVVYGGWGDAGRDQQAYTVYYATVAAPTNFIWLASANYNPANPSAVQSATRATFSAATGGPLATNVAALMFDFTTPAPENGYCGYSEISVYGTSIYPAVTQNTLPVTAADVVGGQVTFTAAFSGVGLAYQWQKISGGVTNNVAGATNSILTLTNLQLANTASYQLRATNTYGVAVSSPGALTVSSVPAAVNNVITSLAAQTGTGSGTFTPTWTVVTNNSLIAGQSPSSTSGSFTLEVPGRNVGSLTDGGNGSITQISATSGYTTSINYVTCGNSGGAGATVIYTLTGSASGFSLTNLTVYGGWADGGRDQQAYTVYYSTVAAPATFISLGSVNYNPANAANAQSATRATLTAASGALATNVAAVKFDFTNPTSENGYCGYTEILLAGVPTPQPVKWAVASGNWDTSTLNWKTLPGGTVTSYQENNLVALDDSATGSSPITLTLTGNHSPTVLTNNSTKTYVLAGSFGVTSGSLIKNGTGTLMLDNGGANSFSSLQINGGTVQVGNSDTNGSLGSGALTNNAVLAFKRTDVVTVSNLISGTGSVVQLGSGTLSLNVADIYTGSTTVNAGTLALVEPGSVGASTLIAVSNGATLDVTGRADQTLTLNSGKTLKGSGTLKGKLAAQAGSTLNPGDGIGTLNVQSNIVLNGLLVMELNRTNGVPNDRLVSGVGAITAGGTLTVSNLGPALQAGDIFQLFNQPVSGFTTVNLPSVTPNAWANNLVNNGTLSVVSTASPVLLSQLSMGNLLTLSWPGDHLGWRLQVQTNSLAQGLGTNWVDVAGSSVTNQLSFPINPGNGSVFYRLWFQ